MIRGTPRDANSLRPVPSAARPSRTALRMLFSFTCHLQLRLIVGKLCIRTHSTGAMITSSKLYRVDLENSNVEKLASNQYLLVQSCSKEDRYDINDAGAG